MARPMFFADGSSARERYDGVAANLFEVENERDFELFKRQCLTFVKAGNLFRLRELISKWKKNKKAVSLNFRDSETGNTPLIWAAVQNDKQMLQLLLEQDVDLTLRNKEKKTAVHIANNDLQKLMLSAKLWADLKHAAWQGNVLAVKEMLRKESDVNERNTEGMTPLSLATRDINFFEKLPQMKDYNPMKVVKTLLDHNVNISLDDFDGKTPVHHLVENIGLNARNVMKAMIGRTKRIDAVDEREMTPLHTAAKLGDAKIVEMLLKNGASVSCRSFDGKTPLHYAVMCGHDKVANLLIKWQADVNSADDKGKTPWDFAKKQKNEKLLEVLRQTIIEDTDSSDDSDDDAESVGADPSTSCSDAELSSFAMSTQKNLPSLKAPLKRNSTEPELPLTGIKLSNESTSHVFKLPNLEFHARPSLYSPMISSQRAKSAKKTASLPNSFKFEGTSGSDTEECDVYGHDVNGFSVSSIEDMGSLNDRQPERLARSLEIAPSVNVIENAAEMPTDAAAEYQNRSNISSIGIKRKQPLLNREQLAPPNLQRQLKSNSDSTQQEIQQHLSGQQEVNSNDQNNNKLTFQGDSDQQNALLEERRDSVCDLAYKPPLRRRTSSIERGKLASNGFTSRMLKSGGIGGRGGSEIRDVPAESSEIIATKFADGGKTSDADSNLPALQTINLELGVQNTHPDVIESRCASSVLRSNRSRKTSSAVSSNSEMSSYSFGSPSMSQFETRQSQNAGSKVLEVNPPRLSVGESSNRTLNPENFETVCEKLKESGLTTINTDAAEPKKNDFESEVLSNTKNDDYVSSSNTEETQKKVENVKRSSPKKILPPLEINAKGKGSRRLRNRSNNLSVDGTIYKREPVEPAPQTPEGSKKANLIHVSLPRIKYSVLKRSRAMQSSRKDGTQLSKPRQVMPGKHESVRTENVTNGKGEELEAKREALDCAKKTSNPVGLWPGNFPSSSSSPSSSDSYSSSSTSSSSSSSSSASSWSTPSSYSPSSVNVNNIPNLPQEDTDLPRSCTDSPPSSLSPLSSAIVISQMDETHFTPELTGKCDLLLNRQIQAQLSVVQESSNETGLDANNSESESNDREPSLNSSLDSSLDSSLNSSVTIDMESTTSAEQTEDCDDQESVRLVENLKKITFETDYEPCENVEENFDAVRCPPENSSSENYFREMTEIAFAPGINSAISNVPSQRISRRSSLVRSSICTQTSIDGSDCCEDELHGWLKGAVIDKGAYGTVYLGMTNRGKLVAVKEVELNQSDADEAEIEYRKLQEEIEMLKSLTHRYIVKFIGTIMEDNLIDIFMEYIPGGSLALALKQFGPLSEKVFRRFTRQIISAVVYIHHKGIVHRDIKGANIMLTSGGVVKLIDFGCAKQLKRSLTSSSGQLRSCQGTPYWMAPEVIRGIAYGVESDIWSIGCTVFEMATGKPPWTGCKYAAMYAIATNQSAVPELPSQFSQDAREFVSRCLIREQDQRATAKQLMKHRFIKYQSFDKLHKISVG